MKDEPWHPPKPEPMGLWALLGDLMRRRGMSMLNLLPKRAYSVQMGIGRLASQKIFLVNAPETVKQVLVKCPRDFPKHHFLEDILKPLIGLSLFNANGEAWSTQRTRVDQAFEVARLRQVFPLMLLAIDDLVASLQRELKAAPAREGLDAVDLDIGEQMGHVTADIIFRTLFSTAFEATTAHKVYQAFVAYQHNAQRVMGLSALRLPTFWHRHLCKVHGQAIRQAFAPLVRHRFAMRTRGEVLPPDMVTALMQAQDPSNGDRFSETEVIDQVGTLFLAGHETSASTLTWALYLLARCPDLQNRLRQEVDALWGERAPEFGDTRQLPGFQSLLKETLRLYPPIAFYVRKAASDTCLRGKPLVTEDMVVVSPWVIHRHEAHWTDPDAFQPERFDETGPSSQTYLPFGLGERACPGAAFATQESVLVLARLLQNFEVEPCGDAEPIPVAKLTLRPAQPLRLRLKPRRISSMVRYPPE